MTKKWFKRFKEAQSFEEWLCSLRRFSNALVIENKVQMWTMADYKTYWNSYKSNKV